MNTSLLFILAMTFILSINSQSNYPYLCLEYSSQQCIKCPLNTHVYQNQCYNNTVGCLEYFNGEKCRNCNTTYTTLQGNTCIPLFQGNQLLSYIQQSNINVGDMYGERAFAYISLAYAQNDNLFQICNNYMLTGQYKHFISKTNQPIVSVNTFDQDGVRQFKILYEGSGGSILLCLIGIDITTNQLKLRSFVVIAMGQVVDYCVDYSTTQTICLRCQDDYHLDNGVCYQNSPGCITYFKNICTECKGFALLIENKCVSDCQKLSDTRSLRFYNNFVIGNAIPSIQRAYYSI